MVMSVDVTFGLCLWIVYHRVLVGGVLEPVLDSSFSP